jgi:hypothetical protein
VGEQAGTTDKHFLYWGPRLLAILFILFISLFSLDVFDTGLGFPEVLLALFMHLIPSLVLLVVLLIAWKYELVGTVVFGLFGLLYVTLIIVQGSPVTWTFIIAGPAFLVAGLFYAGWKEKKGMK